MSRRRSYGQACPVAHALDLIGERWALLVVRELRLGPRRFSDLQDALPGLGPTMLSQRLRQLEEVGVLTRNTLPPPANARVYALSTWGSELEPVFAALAAWGARSPVVPLGGDVSSDTVMLGLRTFFQPDPGEPWSATYEVWLGRECYTVGVEQGRLTGVARREANTEAEVVVHASSDAFLTLLNGEVSVRAAMANERISVTGNVWAVQRLVDARRVPAAAAAKLDDGPSPAPVR